jgi:hypothetical protein
MIKLASTAANATISRPFTGIKVEAAAQVEAELMSLFVTSSLVKAVDSPTVAVAVFIKASNWD